MWRGRSCRVTVRTGIVARPFLFPRAGSWVSDTMAVDALNAHKKADVLSHPNQAAGGVC